MDVRLPMTTKLWESVVIIVAAYLLSCANSYANDCSFSDSTTILCKNITAIPDWIPSNITKIYLSENQFLKLQKDSFVRFTNLQSLVLQCCNFNQELQLPKSLQTIDLSDNPFLKLQVDSFARFAKLKSLELRRCNLNQELQLPKSLQTIDLSENSLLKLQVDSFARLTMLESLELRRCNLNQELQLPKSLHTIDLSENPFLKLQVDSFARLTTLKSLALRRCNLNQELQLPKSLQIIDLSENPLLKLQGDSIVRFTNLKSLELRHCNLNQPLQLPKNLEYIDLSDNPLLKLQQDSFLKLCSLETLKLPRCNLNLPLHLPKSLCSINLEGNSFSMENVAAMFKMMQKPRIFDIRLGANNLTLDGNLSVFPKSVSYLTLNKNILRKIQVDDFKDFSQLKSLDLRSNGLHSIAAGAFDHLKELYQITLSDNHIAHLPKKLFQHSPKTSVIELENTHLRDIPDLSGIKYPSVLHLSRNRIKAVNCSNFGVRKIHAIFLASNEIQSFNFSGLTYKILDISNNRISRIEQGSLGENSNIFTLHLQRNNITALSRACFQGIHSIKELHLQSNKLQWIEKGTFRHMSIEKLLLFNNSLTTMDGVLDGMKKQPNMLLLFGNPHISLMRASDFKNMTTVSQIYIGCRFIKTFSSPFVMKAKLICSPSKKLVIKSLTKGLEGNGFMCDAGTSGFNCQPCKPGEHDAGIYFKGQHCVPCPYGEFYQDEMASVVCKKCPTGQYVPPYNGPGKSPLDCLTCPKGTNTNASAGYRACLCLQGYSRKYRFGACERCTRDGFKCEKDYPELRQGYWMSWDKIKACRDSFISFMSNLDTTDDTYDRKTNHFNCSLPIAHKCPIAKSCKGGVNAECHKGYTGVLCAVCGSGYMKQFNKCVICPSPVVSVVECIAYFLLFVILCWLMSKVKNITLVGRDNERNERTFADLIQSSLKILMGFYQVLVRIIYAFSNIQWPSSLTHAVKVFEFIELSVLRIPSLHCIRSDWRLNAIGEFWISLIAMVAIPSLVLVYFALKVAISFYCNSRNGFGQKRMDLLKNCLQSIVLFFFATYPFISTKIFHVLPGSCHTLCTMKENGHCLNKISYLRSDYSVECPHGTDNSSVNAIYAYVSLLFPIGLPCLLLVLLWRFAPKQNAESQHPPHASIEWDEPQENEERWYLEWEGYNMSLANCENRNSQENTVVTFALRMTYGNYKKSCWYWEFIEMIRKLVMVIASSFFFQDVKIGLYSNILLSIVFVVLHVRKWPMKDSFDNYMQLLALVSVTVNLCYSVTKASNIGDTDIIDNEKDVFGLGLMLVCLNSLVVILIVGRFAKEVAVKLIQRRCAGSCLMCCSFKCCNLQRSGDGNQELQL